MIELPPHLYYREIPEPELCKLMQKLFILMPNLTIWELGRVTDKKPEAIKRILKLVPNEHPRIVELVNNGTYETTKKEV